MSYAEDTDDAEQISAAEQWCDEQEHDRKLQAYHAAVNVPLGAKSMCFMCGEVFTKKHPSQRFCGTKVSGRSSCKDRYHNTMNPRGLQRSEP